MKKSSADYTERFVEDFLTTLKDRKATELKAAAVSSVDEEGWRRLTGNGSVVRELLTVNQERMQEIAFWLWSTNPLARWIINIITAFVVGNGFTIEAKNEEIKNLLQKFWKNNFKRHLKKHFREWLIFGELLLPKFMGYYSGKVATGYIDPVNIKSVITDPQNVKVIIGVIVKGTDMQDGKKYKTVLDADIEEMLSAAARAWRENTDYECYFASLGNVTNDPRGKSELLDIADWLDQYEQFLFDAGEKWTQLNAFIWDLTVKNGDQTAVENETKKLTKKSGSVFGHNENVELKPSAPDLKTFDAETGLKVIRNHILGAKCIPTFWYGGGQDSNLAVSQEMSAPTYKMLSDYQEELVALVTDILDDVIRESEAHGMLNNVPADERGYSVNTPELANKDITKFSAAIRDLTTSLVTAVTNEMMTTEEATKVFVFALGMIGYKIDVEALAEEIKNKGLDSAYQDYLKKLSDDKSGKGTNGI